MIHWASSLKHPCVSWEWFVDQSRMESEGITQDMAVQSLCGGRTTVPVLDAFVPPAYNKCSDSAPGPS
jgi:hypothetical protein